MASCKEDDLIRRSYELRKLFRTTVSNRSMVNQFVGDIEVEVNTLRATMRTIEHKINRWTEVAGIYRSLASPIHAMPPEILSMIFEFACEVNEFSRTTLPPTLVLSMVCGRWRDTIHATPSLWSSIDIDFASWTEDYHILNQLAAKFVDQSGTSPLHLAISFPEDDFGNESARVDALPIIKLLVANCSRWRSLELWLPRPPLLRPVQVLQPIRGRLPALEHLFLSDTKGSNNWDFALLDLFKDCPSLQSMHIKPCVFDREVLRVPWHQIEILHICHTYAVNAFPMLSLCPKVRRLQFTNAGGLNENGEQDYTGHVVHPSTSFTVVCATEQEEVNNFFRHTTLPALYSLTIEGPVEINNEWVTWDDHTTIQHFLDRSSCSINSLSLVRLPITDDQTLDLLRMIPSVETLTIEELDGDGGNQICTKAFFDGLTRPTSSIFSTSPFLPRLTHFKMVVHSKGLDAQAVERTITARWTPDVVDSKESDMACLRSFEIVVWKHEDDDSESTLDCLRCFEDAGMKLLITYMNSEEEEEEGGQGEED